MDRSNLKRKVECRAVVFEKGSGTIMMSAQCKTLIVCLGGFFSWVAH